jgi:hypothetical protein
MPSNTLDNVLTSVQSKKKLGDLASHGATIRIQTPPHKRRDDRELLNRSDTTKRSESTHRRDSNYKPSDRRSGDRGSEIKYADRARLPTLKERGTSPLRPDSRQFATIGGASTVKKSSAYPVEQARIMQTIDTPSLGGAINNAIVPGEKYPPYDHYNSNTNSRGDLNANDNSYQNYNGADKNQNYNGATNSNQNYNNYPTVTPTNQRSNNPPPVRVIAMDNTRPREPSPDDGTGSTASGANDNPMITPPPFSTGPNDNQNYLGNDVNNHSFDNRQSPSFDTNTN